MINEVRTRYLKDEGIVLASQNLGEADKILTIFTKNFGKLEVLAKNVKKLESKRASACEILSYNKFAIGKSKLLTLSETLNLDQFLKIKSNLPKLSLAFLALEVLNLTIPIGVPYPEIFQSLISFLKKLTNAVSIYEAKVKLAAFQIKLLVKTGWLGDNFQVKNFANFGQLEKFLLSKFEEISQKKLKSAEFAKLLLG